MTERKMVLHEIQGSKIYLYPDDPGLSKQLIERGIREEEATRIFRDAIRPGWVHVDIGANLGYYALQAAKLVGTKGKVHAIEPVPENVAALEASKKANGYRTRIKTYQLAISNQNGTAAMKLAYASNWGRLGEYQGTTEAIERAWEKRSSGRTIEVPTRTLDTFVKEQGINKINSLRMDVEGHEVQVIEGAKETLKQNPQMKLFIEVHFNHFKDPRKTFGPMLEAILEAGFQPQVAVAQRTGATIENLTRYDYLDRIFEIPNIRQNCPHFLFEKKPEKLSILVPFRPTNPEFTRIWDWNHRRYKKILPEAELIVEGDGATKGEFNKAKAVNRAAAKATGDIYLIADVDLVMEKEDITAAVAALKDYALVIPHAEHSRVNQKGTEQILKSSPEANVKPAGEDIEETKDLRHILTGGFQIIRRETFNAVNGFDERFVGWGGEDTAFAEAVTKAIGPGTRLEAKACHLWHPRADTWESYKEKDNPNRQLKKRYVDAPARNQVMAIIKEQQPLEKRVDFYTVAKHYLDHQRPIWEAIPEKHRGKFYVNNGELQATVLDLPLEIYQPGDRPLVVGGYWGTKPQGRDIILINHGAGQSYKGNQGTRRSGPGAADREKVVLYLDPNEYASQLNQEAYPEAQHKVIGCPKLDPWHLRTRQGKIKQRGEKPVIAISFHFDAGTAPEAKSSWPHFKKAMQDLARMNSLGRWEVLGHGHPRIIDLLKAEYDRLGIETVYDFNEVMERADLYINDQMSTLYEFASTDRPVVVLNAPWYRREVEHGLRFWEHADVGLNCDEPEELVETIKEALEDPEVQKAKREKAVAAVYPYRDGKAAKRAAEAITEFLETYTPREPAKAARLGTSQILPEHYRGGEEVMVTNTDKNPIERAGLLFMPRSPVRVNQNRRGYAEIKACQLLEIKRIEV